jgi:hypothetical protein
MKEESSRDKTDSLREKEDSLREKEDNFSEQGQVSLGNFSVTKCHSFLIDGTSKGRKCLRPSLI